MRNTEPEGCQTAKISFLSSDRVVQNCVTVFTQNSSISYWAVHNHCCFKSNKALKLPTEVWPYSLLARRPLLHFYVCAQGT